jgi:hypothetical protein
MYLGVLPVSMNCVAQKLLDVRIISSKGLASARTPAPLPSSRVPRPPASTWPACTSGDCLPLSASDTEARQQEGEEGDATLNLVLEHLDATIVTYI